MKNAWRSLSLLFLFLMTGCTLPASAQAVSTPIPSPLGQGDCLSPLRTSWPSPLPITPLPAAATSTPSPDTPQRCDLAASDYCLEAGFFVLVPPIMDVPVDSSYRYGSTQGGIRIPHHGVEFPSPLGTPVLAAANGVVWYAGEDRQTLFAPWPNFYGNLIILEHHLPDWPARQLYTLYAHLSRLDVSAGQVVRAGDRLGLVGMSGSALGSHLHFEVRLEAKDYLSTLNPELYLRPLAGHGVLAIQLTDSEGKPLAIAPNIQFHPDSKEGNVLTMTVEPYATETINPQSPWQENIGLGNLPAGHYRLTCIYWGKLHERWIVIEAGKLTVVRWQLARE